MLAAGLASRTGAGGSRRARTPYGDVVLGAARGGREAAVATPGGVLHAPDLLLEVRVAGMADVTSEGLREAAG